LLGPALIGAVVHVAGVGWSHRKDLSHVTSVERKHPLTARGHGGDGPPIGVGGGGDGDLGTVCSGGNRQESWVPKGPISIEPKEGHVIPGALAPSGPGGGHVVAGEVVFGQQKAGVVGVGVGPSRLEVQRVKLVGHDGDVGVDLVGPICDDRRTRSKIAQPGDVGQLDGGRGVGWHGHGGSDWVASSTDRDDGILGGRSRVAYNHSKVVVEGWPNLGVGGGYRKKVAA